MELDVRKTYKLYIGGKFVRSESGRTYMAKNSPDNFPRSTRKDVRNAIVAARSGFSSWSNATAYNRGQVLYRMAEMLSSRKAEFAALLGGGDAEVEAAVQTLVWYAGWCDKITAVAGSVNPVAGPYFSFTFPEPTGVVGIIAHEERPLLSLVRALAPAICSGNSTVVILAEHAPVAGLLFAEVIAVSDVPFGVVNLISGLHQELVPTLASHLDVNALEARGCSRGELFEVEELASGSVKRVVVGSGKLSLQSITNLMEMKTVWHPIGV